MSNDGMLAAWAAALLVLGAWVLRDMARQGPPNTARAALEAAQARVERDDPDLARALAGGAWCALCRLEIDELRPVPLPQIGLPTTCAHHRRVLRLLHDDDADAQTCALLCLGRYGTGGWDNDD